MWKAEAVLVALARASRHFPYLLLSVCSLKSFPSHLPSHFLLILPNQGGWKMVFFSLDCISVLRNNLMQTKTLFVLIYLNWLKLNWRSAFLQACLALLNFGYYTYFEWCCPFMSVLSRALLSSISLHFETVVAVAESTFFWS